MKAERQYKEVTSRVIQPAKGDGRYIVDNRPSFMAINETKGLMSNNPIAQRMVIVGSEPEEVDSVIAADISFQHEKAGGVLLSLSDLLSADQDKFAIKDDGSEGIILTTHGEPGKVGDFDPSEIIDGLKKIANIEKTKYIYIASCDAATSPVGGGPSVVEVIGKEFSGINVYGAPGIAITDYRGITGDHQTVYKKNDHSMPFEAIACFIEDVVTFSLFSTVKDSLKLPDLTKIEEKGKELRSDPCFNKFYDTLINALLGRLDIKDFTLLIQKYEEKCKEMVVKTTNPDAAVDYKKQIDLIKYMTPLVEKQIPVITNGGEADPSLRDQSGNPFVYDKL